MTTLKPIHTLLIVGAAVIAVMSLLSGPVSAQEPSPPSEADNSGRGNESSYQQIRRTQQRQLGNVPDDIGYQLQESQESIDAVFPVGPLTPLHNLWDASTDRLRESIGLDLGLNYTAIYQAADTTVGGPRDAAGGDFDFFGRWHLLGCEDCCPGALVFSTESRHRYTDIPPAALDTGTVGGTIVTFGTQDFSFVQTYWEQRWLNDDLLLRLGKMDPALIWDGGRYVSDNYAFFSPAFSDTAPMALPDAGLGAAGAVYPTHSTYIAAGVHDANGRRTTAGFDTFFGEGEYFTAVEFGWLPNDGETNEGLYHATFWSTDARQAMGRPSDRGVALTFEQQVGCEGNLVPFLRYAYAHRGLNGIRQNLSVGLGIEEMFGQNDDVIGLALSWGQPSNRLLRDQSVIETFYRFYITPHTHVTPDIQIVIDPANAPDKDVVTVFGLRLRTLF